MSPRVSSALHLLDMSRFIDPGVQFGDRGCRALHIVGCESPCGRHPVDSAVHFRTFRRQYGKLW